MTKIADTSVAIAAPLTPKLKLYIKIGSRTMFRMADVIMAYMGLLLSPSPRKIPYNALERIMKIEPAKIIIP